MGHPAIENTTHFAFAPVFLTDEEARPLLVNIVKATYCIAEAGLCLSEQQLPVNLTGEYWGRPEESSYKYEPEGAFIKLATDVVLIGHAWPRRQGDTKGTVNLRVGALVKSISVVGDRYWVKSLGATFASPAEPFERIPLTYERAFGGWDRSHPDPKRHTFEPRNPVGAGFRAKHGRFEEGIRLPNLEDPGHPIKDYWDTPPPVGFGFNSPDWHPRSKLAGTYDETWMKDRMPLLPLDFNRSFLNAASPGLQSVGFLNGDESVIVENTCAEGSISFDLPHMPTPKCLVEVRGRKREILETRLDTVIINTDDRLLVLIWRGNTVVTNSPHDLISVKVQADESPAVVGHR